MTRRIAIGLSYDGSAYHGWQRQDSVPGLPTVQYYVERALTSVANHHVEVVCAGRTDAKVHAVGQVLHFDTDAKRDNYSWVFGANSNLPHNISVHWAKEVDLEFHARFKAEARRYRYLIYNDQIRPAIMRHFVSWIRKPLDVGLMQLGARYLIGEHDFSSFRGADCQAKTAVRDMQLIELSKKGRVITMDIQANAFLLHMVRNVVGVLAPIGLGIQPPEWAKEVLEAQKRTAAGVTASPNGLYLTSVKYPDSYIFPKNEPAPEVII